MKGVSLPFPYLRQLIQIAVLTSVLALFAVLFITIGVATQAAGVFRGLIVEAQKHLREGSTVERSGTATQHRNLFAAPPSFLDDPVSFLSSRVNLELASSQRSSHSHSSSRRRLRSYGLFAPAAQALAFVLIK